LSDTVAATGDNTVSFSKKLIPGAVKVTLKDENGVVLFVATDDRKGNLISSAGTLVSGTIDYITGTVVFQQATITATDTYEVKVVADVAGETTINKNRVKNELQNVTIPSEPDLLIAENNLMTVAAMQKNLGIDPQAFMSQKLTTLYTQLINERLTSAIINADDSTPFVIDISTATTGFSDFRSGLDKFSGGLIEVDGKLAIRSTKGVKATSYLVSPSVADTFRKCRTIAMWDDNASVTHVEDLVGFYDGIPVLRHKAVEEDFAYACHKTADGQMAPCMRGIFLPLTNTPSIGNYNNPTQFAQGVYYQEGVESIAPELVQKFKVIK
jgi:hypothetical protein